MPDPQDILNWYDAHARVIPWRVPPSGRARAGARGKNSCPQPYPVWLSEVMLQQTTVVAVIPYFQDFTKRWPTVKALAEAQDSEVMATWAGLGYYARARNLLKTARIIARDYGGAFPREYEALLALPGIGPYTAAAICAICYDARVAVLDGNIERVLARVFAIKTPLPEAKKILGKKALHLTPKTRAGDYVQGLMDLGAGICTPRNPKCGLCPWRESCRAYSLGIAESLPRKIPKGKKPQRLGAVYVLERDDGALLLERRADSGLLGGMLGWLGSDWEENTGSKKIKHKPPMSANWVALPQPVTHIFTHFHLELFVHIARADNKIRVPKNALFIKANDFDPSDLPSLMQKVWRKAAPELEKMQKSEKN